MNYKLIILLILVLSISSCLKKAHKEDDSILKKKDSISQGRGDSVMKSYESLSLAFVSKYPNDSNCISFDKEIAIVISPDSSWFSKQIKDNGEDAWNEIISDHEYYVYEGLKLLEKKGIRIEYKNPPQRYIKFIKQGGKSVCVDRELIKEYWGVILFHPSHDPVFWISTDLDDAIKDIYCR